MKYNNFIGEQNISNNTDTYIKYFYWRIESHCNIGYYSYAMMKQGRDHSVYTPNQFKHNSNKTDT